jgi:AAA+ superfamily predicted ATPase
VDEKTNDNSLAMKKSTNDSIHTLEAEISWFSSVVDNQFKVYFQQESDVVEDISMILPPDLSLDTSYYGEFVRENNLTYKDRLAIMLALMPHLRPQLLDIFFTKNAHFDRNFTEFGGSIGKKHGGFMPTGETLHFLINRANIFGRWEVEQMLSEQGILIQKDVLRLERTEVFEPVLCGSLVVTEEFRTYLFLGKHLAPQSGELFPARKITTHMNWEDLIVSGTIREEIEQIRLWIESEKELMNCDTFRKHVKSGYRALFYGPPGTGKTLTACLVGRSTGLDVYRIDLSLIVSKYIGETEKNLSRVFDVAMRRKWILFFDEADSLFGKRTQTSSSNDRYANQEVSYLLQRVEDFPGTIILASNLKSNMDEAFTRRFQAMIYFPIPNSEQRLQLWNQFFSGNLKPDDTLNLATISEKYELSGGSAINVFRYCALRAAARKSTKVRQEDMIQGIRREFQKYGKTI